MKIDFTKYLRQQGSIVNWAIIHMMTLREKNLKLPEWKMKHEGGPLDTANMDITLTINGVEVDFIKCIEDIEKQHDYQITAKAKELLEEESGEFFSKMEELKECVDDLIRKERQKLEKEEEQ